MEECLELLISAFDDELLSNNYYRKEQFIAGPINSSLISLVLVMNFVKVDH